MKVVEIFIFLLFFRFAFFIHGTTADKKVMCVYMCMNVCVCARVHMNSLCMHMNSLFIGFLFKVQHYIVYMGHHSHPDSDSVITANHEMLASVIGRHATLSK